MTPLSVAQPAVFNTRHRRPRRLLIGAQRWPDRVVFRGLEDLALGQRIAEQLANQLEADLPGTTPQILIVTPDAEGVGQAIPDRADIPHLDPVEPDAFVGRGRCLNGLDVALK